MADAADSGGPSFAESFTANLLTELDVDESELEQYITRVPEVT